MRHIVLAVCFCVPLMGQSQVTSSTGQGIKPEAYVQVGHSVDGADMVSITFTDTDYPLDLVKAQAEAVGAGVGSSARGIQFLTEDPTPGVKSSTMPKTTFAVTGLIDSSNGVLRLGPIVRALAGAPAPHTINAFFLLFEGQRPTIHTLGDFSSSAVNISRHTAQDSTEYQVTLLSQDPKQIVIPDSADPQTAPAPSPKPRSGPDIMFDAILAVAALAAGALVYSLLLMRPASKGKPRT